MPESSSPAPVDESSTSESSPPLTPNDDSPTGGPSDHELSYHFRPQNPHAIVEAFVRGHPGPMTSLIKKILSTMNPRKLEGLIKGLIDTLADSEFRNGLLRALKHHIATHPWQTAFFVIGIILILNPIALAGFGALGPVVGSFAAAWQASIGSVAAGSVFATLQSVGMLGAVAIPAAGVAVAGAAVASTAVLKLVNEYDEPVKDWWEKNCGKPVKDWWEGVVGTKNDRSD